MKRYQQTSILDAAFPQRSFLGLNFLCKCHNDMAEAKFGMLMPFIYSVNNKMGPPLCCGLEKIITHQHLYKLERGQLSFLMGRFGPLGIMQ